VSFQIFQKNKGKSVDDADRAQARIEEELEREIAVARAGTVYQESANECVECGALIPSERQIAVPGCQCCADCAAALERVRAFRR
jgi:phage/conjugal plasmid C-4 type zinc finger TraR family protein